MGQYKSLSISVVCLLSSLSAQAVTMDVTLPVLFLNSTVQHGRNVNSVGTTQAPAPTVTFKKAVHLNHNGATQVGDRCSITSIQSSEGLGRGYFNSPLTHTPAGEIAAKTSFEMRLVSYQDEVLKIELSNLKALAHPLELTCTQSNVKTWTVSQFESNLNQNVRVHAPDALSKIAFEGPVARSGNSVKDLRGSFFNGLFGSGLPGTMGIQLLFGANLKAFAEESNASIMVGKRCRLMSQSEQAISAEYHKGAKFAFREYRATEDSKRVELVFDNWNHSPHQVRVQCQGTMTQVKKMTFAEVERDLNGSIEFYEKKAI